MTLRFKRNLPLVIILTAILVSLVLIIGNQPIVSYTFNPETVPAASFTAISNGLGQLTGGFTLVQP